MANVSEITTAISTAGTLVGALGGVALTYGVGARREERRSDRERQDHRAQERRQAYLDLLGAAAQLKVQVEIAGQCFWSDMDARLAAIQGHATSASLHAARAALFRPGAVADAAEALATAAGQLAAATARDTEMRTHDERFLGGKMTTPPDFASLDECVRRFYVAAAKDAEQ
jgi:hypothetical protein